MELQPYTYTYFVLNDEQKVETRWGWFAPTVVKITWCQFQTRQRKKVTSKTESVCRFFDLFFGGWKCFKQFFLPILLTYKNYWTLQNWNPKMPWVSKIRVVANPENIWKPIFRSLGTICGWMFLINTGDKFATSKMNHFSWGIEGQSGGWDPEKFLPESVQRSSCWFFVEFVQGF